MLIEGKNSKTSSPYIIVILKIALRISHFDKPKNMHDSNFISIDSPSENSQNKFNFIDT